MGEGIKAFAFLDSLLTPEPSRCAEKAEKSEISAPAGLS
jgi:hypothetical protein